MGSNRQKLIGIGLLIIVLFLGYTKHRNQKTTILQTKGNGQPTSLNLTKTQLKINRPTYTQKQTQKPDKTELGNVANSNNTKIVYYRMDPSSMAGFLKTGDKDNLPKDLAKAFADGVERDKAALATESSARERLKELSGCLSNPAPDYSQQAHLNMPAEVKQTLKQLGKDVEADCRKKASTLVKKYPNLRSDYEWALRNKTNH